MSRSACSISLLLLARASHAYSPIPSHNPSNDRFTMTISNNATHVTRDLNIRQTQPIDAGLYVCVENVRDFGVQEIHSAQLVILGQTNDSLLFWQL